MAVRKEKDDTWTYDYYYFDLVKNKRVRVRKMGFESKKKALAWANNNIKKESVSTSMTFEELFKAYQQDSDAAEDTKKDKLNSTKRHLVQLFNSDYDSMTKVTFSEWRNVISGLDLATTTKNQLITRIKATTKFAYNVYDLDDKAKHLKRFKKELHEQKEMDTWTNEEFMQFIQCVDNDVYNYFFRLLFYTGMRRGEARALHKDDLLDSSEIKINKSMRRNIEKVTKTRSSIRTIEVDKDTYNKCNELKDTDGRYLFGGLEPLSNSQIQRFFDLGIKLSGVKKIRLHDLRHSHATILINSGANIVAVSKRLGHSSVKTTLSTYTHLMKDSNDGMMNIINNLSNISKNGQ
ncbi:MAG: tyrosine-type recombinase/integrase [Anaerorhabdus sp.]|uniref:site-specific integrase n=1 Tax=Anaerorhabdus sp. TaxID=1872524 RepID=UPI002FC966D4